MSERTQVMLSERDGARIDRLIRAESEVQQQDSGELSSFVMQECIRLWREVIETLGRFAVTDKHGSPAVRSEIADASADAPINLLEQAAIDTLIFQFNQADLADSEAMHEVSVQSLAVLEQQMKRLTEPTSSGAVRQPRIIKDSTVGWVDSQPEFTVWRSRSQVLRESLRTLRLLDELRAKTAPVIASVQAAQGEAQGAGQELDRLRSELAQARAEKAQGELSNQFKTLGEREHRTSWAFRLVTFLLAAVALGVAFRVPENAGWPDVTTHLAVVGILAGSSAYAARLASAHRSMGDWADSVRVQLNTFKDFLGVVDSEDARMRVYEEFGRRVLGPPPAVGGEYVEGASLPVTQLVQLANEISASRR